MITLTPQQAGQLKHRPDTGQGLRDQALMCLLLNEKLPVKVICTLRATSLDTDARVLVISDAEEMPLTEETFSTLRTYVARTRPSVGLLQVSVSNGELDGGKMTAGAIYARVAYLGETLGLKERLTIDACLNYQDPQLDNPPKIRERIHQRTLTSHSSAHVPGKNDGLITPKPFTHPHLSIDALIEGLGNLDTWLRSIVHIKEEGNITPDLEFLCQNVDEQCTALTGELLALQRIVNILPLHFMLLRLFPHIEDISESVLLHLEVCTTDSFMTSFEKALPRSVAEEQAVYACEAILKGYISEEKLQGCRDLLRGIAVYAGMYVQRKREAVA